MRTPGDEQETIMRWYQTDDIATVYTSSYSMMRRFDEFVDSGDWELIKVDKCEGDIVSKTYKVPKELLYGRRVKKKIAPLTEEEKKALAMRFKL